jgi:hypothetical protein
MVDAKLLRWRTMNWHLYKNHEVSISLIGRVQAGMKKADYWDPTFEDMLTLIARLPRIAALIYRHVFRNGEITKLVRARPRPRPS